MCVCDRLRFLSFYAFVCFSVCLPVDYVYWCSCPLFWFLRAVWPALVYLSNHAVLLVAVFLHKSPFPPYQRGFFCNDNSIRLPYKSSTVSTTVLTAVGVTVPVASVSPGFGAARELESICWDTLNSSNDWLETTQKTWLVWKVLTHHSVGRACCTSLALDHVCSMSLPTIFQSI